jgi:hypothetical protein
MLFIIGGAIADYRPHARHQSAWVSCVRGKIEMCRRRAGISCDPAKGQIALQYSKTSSLRIDTPYPHERWMGLCSTVLAGKQYRISTNLEGNLAKM